MVWQTGHLRTRIAWFKVIVCHQSLISRDDSKFISTRLSKSTFFIKCHLIIVKIMQKMSEFQS